MIDFETPVPVKLKGAGGGLWVTIDPSHPEDLLTSEIDKLFVKLRHLTVNASVVLDLGEDSNTPEYQGLIDRIKSRLIEKFDVGRVSTPPKKRSIPTARIRQRDVSRGWDHHRSDVLMLRGRVRSGQKIDTRKHVVITGDVNPGSEIRSGGDVIVLGRLAGKVHAGSPDNTDAIIFALEFNPTHVKIGKISAAGSEEKVGARPEFAYVEDKKIIVKDYMKASPFRKMPWPEAV